ncbi:MAG: hypothetical protein ACKN9U_22620, partial [Pirellulaceae bacterium]
MNNRVIAIGVLSAIRSFATEHPIEGVFLANIFFPKGSHEASKFELPSSFSPCDRFVGKHPRRWSGWGG